MQQKCVKGVIKPFRVSLRENAHTESLSSPILEWNKDVAPAILVTVNAELFLSIN